MLDCFRPPTPATIAKVRGILYARPRLYLDALSCRALSLLCISAAGRKGTKTNTTAVVPALR